LIKKVISGDNVKALSRCLKAYPKEMKAQEGNEQQASLNRLFVATDCCSEESPEGDESKSGAGGVTRW
jgi:hypothetical protein